MEKMVKTKKEIEAHLKSRKYYRVSCGDYYNEAGVYFTNYMFRMCGQRYSATKVLDPDSHMYDYELHTKHGSYLFKNIWLDGGSK